MATGTLHQRNTQRLIVRIALGIMIAAGIGVGTYNATRATPTTSTSTSTTVATPVSLDVRFGQAVTSTLRNKEPAFEFYGQTPSGAKISCELNLAVQWSTSEDAYCVSIEMNHVHSATLSASGKLSLCDGDQCGSNAGMNTPTLAVGSQILSGGFTCLVLSDSVACETTSHQGFNFFVDRTEQFS